MADFIGPIDPNQKPPFASNMLKEDGEYPKATKYVKTPGLGENNVYESKNAHPYNINPADHFVNDQDPAFGGNQNFDHIRQQQSTRIQGQPLQNVMKFMYSPRDHIIYDENESWTHDVAEPLRTDLDGNQYKVFSGAMTLVNPENNPDKQTIMDQGLGAKENDLAKRSGIYAQPPISPFQPFTNMDPVTAQQASFVSYNRSHIPIADAEFRKGFRHIFISRPECYIMCQEGGLSDQAEHNEDFASAYMQYPHLLQILSPSYLASKINIGLDGLVSNWNYLLTNRVTGMSLNTYELGTSANMAKSVIGQQIVYPTIVTSEMNGSLQLTFNETKEFEVSEMVRLWMLYMHNRHRGIFAPSFNNYHKTNSFGMKGHPYDRAIEYPCTIFDIITNESDTRILYYCAYLGAFPTQLSRPFNTQNAGALSTQMQVSVNFQYQAKIENNTKMLVLFNYNSGIVDNMGQPTQQVSESLPFLLQEGELPTNKLLKDYLGASGMFTGAPYTVILPSRKNPINPDEGMLYSPFLKFAPILDEKFNDITNLGIVNHVSDTGNPVSVESQSTEELINANYTPAEVEAMVANGQYASTFDIGQSIQNGVTGILNEAINDPYGAVSTVITGGAQIGVGTVLAVDSAVGGALDFLGNIADNMPFSK